VTEEDLAAIQALGRERGLPAKATAKLTEAVESGQIPPTDVERVLSLSDSIREVEEAASVQPEHVVEAVMIQGQGGIRPATKAASDPDEKARLASILKAQGKAGEFSKAQTELDVGEPRTSSDQEKGIDARLESVRREVQATQMQIKQRRSSIIQRMDRGEQSSMLGEETTTAPESQQMGLAGMESDTSSEGVQSALKNDSRLRELNDKLSALQREYSRLSQEAQAAKREVRRSQTKMELQESARENVTGTVDVTVPSGTEYTVGIAETAMEWVAKNKKGEDQVKYRAPAGGLVVINQKGTPVNRSSSNYLPALEAYLSDPKGRKEVDRHLPPVEENAPRNVLPGEHLRYILEHSQNPYELAQAYRQIPGTFSDTLTQIEEDLVEVGGFGRGSLQEGLEATVGGSANVNSYVGWLRGSEKQGEGSYAHALDVFVEGKPYTVGDVVDVIKRNPSGPSEVRTEAEAYRRQVEEVFDVSLGMRLDEAVVDAILTAEAVSRIHQRVADAERARDVDNDLDAAHAGLENIVYLMESMGWDPSFLEENESLRQLSDRQKSAIEAAWDLFSQPPTEMPFRRLESSGVSMPIETAYRLVQAAVRSVSVEGIRRIVPVRRPTDLPKEARARYMVAAQMYGSEFVQPGMVMPDGTAYVIAEDAALAARDGSVSGVAREVALHEAAHRGMRVMLGDTYTEELSRLFDQIGQEEVQAALGAAYAQEFDRPMTAQHRAFLADEYLAQRAESLPSTNPSLFERVMLWFKRAYARATGETLSDAEVELMLLAAYEAARTENTYTAPTAKGSGDVSFLAAS